MGCIPEEPEDVESQQEAADFSLVVVERWTTYSGHHGRLQGIDQTALKHCRLHKVPGVVESR